MSPYKDIRESRALMRYIEKEPCFQIKDNKSVECITCGSRLIYNFGDGVHLLKKHLLTQKHRGAMTVEPAGMKTDNPPIVSSVENNNSSFVDVKIKTEMVCDDDDETEISETEFHKNLLFTLLSADIPLSVLDHPHFTAFLEKYTLRKVHRKDFYLNLIKELVR